MSCGRDVDYEGVAHLHRQHQHVLWSKRAQAWSGGRHARCRCQRSPLRRRPSEHEAQTAAKVSHRAPQRAVDGVPVGPVQGAAPVVGRQRRVADDISARDIVEAICRAGAGDRGRRRRGRRRRGRRRLRAAPVRQQVCGAARRDSQGMPLKEAAPHAASCCCTIRAITRTSTAANMLRTDRHQVLSGVS